MSIEIKKIQLQLGHAITTHQKPEIEINSHCSMRTIEYQQGSYTETFPLLFCSEHVETCLDMNLFLQQKYTGAFSHHIDTSSTSLKSDVSIKTITSIANSLLVFLKWLSAHGRHWKDNCNKQVTTSTQWLPTYSFRAHLIQKVKGEQLALTTANLYIGHIVQFYYWAYLNNKIQTLPVKISKVPLRKSSKHRTSDILFGFTPCHNSYEVQTHDLRIPQKYRAKTKAFDSDLCPYTTEELRQLITDPTVISAPNKQIWIQLGFRCGLRVFEIAGLNRQDFEPEKLEAFHEVEVTGKKGKVRKANIPLDLVKQIQEFNSSSEQLKRRRKWEEKSLCEEAPLFINRSGGRIKSDSISNLIYPVRKNLANNGIRFKRSDLSPKNSSMIW